MKPKFSLGDLVWNATWQTKQEYDTCLECMGKMYLTVILGDGEKLTIPCECCKRGYDSTGDHIRKVRFAVVTQHTVSGVEVSGHTFNYRLSGDSTGHFWNVGEENVFAVEAEALQRSEELSIQHNAEQDSQKYCKTKSDRSWAWHVKYHRDQLRQALKNVAHHNKMIHIAKTKDTR